MTHRSRSLVLFTAVMLVVALVPTLGCPGPVQGPITLRGRVEALEAQVAELEAKLAHVSVQEGAINGLNGPHLIIEGCNLHVRSGSDDTEDSSGLTGLGNLIVGYNEQPDPVVYGRLGSHNLVLGMKHEYSSYSGFIAGEENAVTGGRASVCGGANNIASGFDSTITGGFGNESGGTLSSVSGGYLRTVSGLHDWAAGNLFEDQ